MNADDIAVFLAKQVDDSGSDMRVERHVIRGVYPWQWVFTVATPDKNFRVLVEEL